MGIGRFVYTPILPFMNADLGLSAAEGGLIASANFLGYLLGAVAASSSRLPGGQRGWLLAGLALGALTTGAMALGSSFTWFVVMRFAGGVTSAFTLVFSVALVLERLAIAGRPQLSSLHFAGVGAGIAVSAVLVSALAACGEGWRAQWLWSGVLSLLAFAAVVKLIPPLDHHQTTAAVATQAVGRPNHRFVSLIIAYGLFGFGYVITATFISVMVRTSAQLAGVEPVVWLTVGLAALPSVAVWTWFGRRAGNNVAYAAASVLLAIGVALSVVASDGAMALLAAALLGGTFMGLAALGLLHARELATGDVRRNIGFMTASFGLGQILGPAFAGLTADAGFGFLVPSLAAAGALLVAALLVLRH